MYDSFNRKRILELASASGPCVSILVPTVPLGQERLEGRIRLKNAITKAVDLLTLKGMRHTIALDLMKPATQLDEDADFWLTQEDGLAIYVAPGVFHAFRLPTHVQALTVVADTFHLRPLLALLADEPFYVLALDEESSRLLRVKGNKARVIKVPNMPESLMAVAGVEHHEKQRQIHAAGRVGRAGSSISHISGDHSDAKDQVLRYCQAVDRALTKHLAKSAAPLLLAADAPISDIYPKSNHYAHFAHERILGSPRRISNEDLAIRASDAIDSPSSQLRRKVILQHAQLAGSGLSSAQIERIVPAAMQGRVDVLIADPDKIQWGRVGPNQEVTVLDDQEPGAEDLIGRAALETFKKGGTYLESAPRQLENGGPLAIFRV